MSPYLVTRPIPGACPSCKGTERRVRPEEGGRVLMVRITHEPDCPALAARRNRARQEGTR